MARQTSITIYHPATNEAIYTMDRIFEGCTEKFTLMQEDFIELKFNTAVPVYLPIGAWTFWNGKQYQVTEQQNPTCNTETGGYEYTLKMEAYYRAWNLRIYKYEADDESITGREATFSLTADLEEHVKLLVKMINKEGFRYETQDTATGLVSDTKQEFAYAIRESDADKRLDYDGTEISNFKTLKTLTYEDAFARPKGEALQRCLLQERREGKPHHGVGKEHGHTVGQPQIFRRGKGRLFSPVRH